MAVLTPTVAPPPEPARRIVLLGASNATLAFRHILPLLGEHWPEPLEILTALGHGRSLGLRSFVLVRSLPGILSCGLWDTLHRQPSLPTHALLTDLGNDILYHVPVPQIVSWAEQILERLRGYQAQIVLTRLPTADLDRLSPARFYFFRSLFMPLCRLSRGEVIERAQELDARLVALGAKYGATMITPRREWYGLDPLHIKRSCRGVAWREITGAWSSAALSSTDDSATSRRLRKTACFWELFTPHERWLGGLHQHRAQPALSFADGSRVSFY